MLTFAVFDNAPANRAAIKDIVVRYTMRSLTDIDVLWFPERVDTEKLKQYAPGIHIALVSLDIRESAAIGKAIYQCNEDCRIIFYSAEARELEPFLCVRPRGYYRIAKKESCLYEMLDSVVSELKNSSACFCHETRRDVFLLPLRQILYFQSDLKHVNIVMTNGKAERICAKLSEVEPSLDSGFLRIHKSYLVNTRRIRAFHKSEKYIELESGQSLPVSDACYKDVAQYFREKQVQ